MQGLLRSCVNKMATFRSWGQKRLKNRLIFDAFALVPTPPGAAGALLVDPAPLFGERPGARSRGKLTGDSVAGETRPGAYGRAGRPRAGTAAAKCHRRTPSGTAS